MLTRIAIICLAISLSCVFAHGEIFSPDTNEIEGNNLSYADAAILGVVEGITEFLPVSSTGHLILTNAILDLDSDTPVTNSSGRVIMIEGEENGRPRPYTLAEASYAFVIIIQAGAIAAVVILYWRTLLSIPLGFLGKNETGRKLGMNLLCAFLPAAIVGLSLNDWIEAALGNNIKAVAAALIIGAVVMLIVERWRKHGKKEAIAPDDGPELHELSILQCLMIGACQCIAMWPGTSRSMATIVGGYLVGLSPKHAAEFSFLLGFITLSAASGYKLVFDGGKMLSAFSSGPVLVGCFIAFISAALAVKWLVGYLSKHGLALFAWYRIALAAVVLWQLG